MLRPVLDVLDLLARPDVTGAAVAASLEGQLNVTPFDTTPDTRSARDSHVDVAAELDPHPTVETHEVTGERGTTEFVRVRIPGAQGRMSGGSAPTLGIVGRLGGIGARPEVIGFVSDGDGAAAALAAASSLLRMWALGDRLVGDVQICTHVCPTAPTLEHDPVPFMNAPVDMPTMNDHEVSADMDAIVSIDTTKGNRLVNHRGIAIAPPVRDGWILRLPEDTLRIASVVTGRDPVVLPLTTQDITPYGNGLPHVNSILQPSTATTAPVIGLAITAQSVVPGCASGASHETDIAEAARFAVELAKEFTAGAAQVHYEEEFNELVRRYGSMRHLQTLGHDDHADVIREGGS